MNINHTSLQVNQFQHLQISAVKLSTTQFTNVTNKLQKCSKIPFNGQWLCRYRNSIQLGQELFESLKKWPMRQHTHALVCVSNSFPFFRILETVNSKWKKILTGILDQEVHSALQMAYLSAYLPHISCLLNFNDLNYYHSEMENHFSVTFNYTPTTAFLK